MTTYQDRIDAGRILAGELRRYAHAKHVIVLALPRGGVPVAHEIAKALGLPLDVFIVRKLGVPGHEELAMGAIGSGGVRVLNENVLKELALSPSQLAHVTAREAAELARRESVYRGTRPYPTIKGNTVILVDDGIATGATMRAAIAGLRELDPHKIIVAVPVAARDSLELIAKEVDEVVCPLVPRDFNAVAKWYDEFPQTNDNEVTKLLQK